MEKARIEEMVAEQLTAINYNSDKDVYVDIVKFAKNLGFVVGNADLSDNEDGFLAVLPQKSGCESKVIGVNAHRSFFMKRFIVAHEIGHWILHCKNEQVFLHRENKKGKNDKENDADYFAAVLLMPKDSFLREYSQLKSQNLESDEICHELSLRFKTPLESVSRRIKEISALD